VGGLPRTPVGVFTPAGTRPGRLRRHYVIGCADPGQNPPAVRFGSYRVRGEGPGNDRALSRRRVDLGDGDQTFQNFGRTLVLEIYC
jgi:hypothetical protein